MQEPPAVPTGVAVLMTAKAVWNFLL